MRVNIYENKHAKVFSNTMELTTVFNTIKTNKPTMPKSERLGVVYASKSSKGRKHEHIESYTGMAFIDVDDCTHPKEVKNLFKVIDCTIACWYSSSGNVHALIKIPICTTKDEFKRRYTLLASDLRHETGSWGHMTKLPATIHNLHSYQVMQKYILMKHQYLMRVSIYLHHHK